MKTLILAIFLLAQRTNLQAYLIGNFPGLSELIEKADAIVILRIDETLQPTEASTGYGTHRCFIYQTLKGNIRTSERITLQLMDTGGERGAAHEPYSRFSTHLVFLTKSEVVFIFESPLGADALEPLLQEPKLWQSVAAWHDYLAGPPRIAEDVYSWERSDLHIDRSLLPPGVRNGDSFDL